MTTEVNLKAVCPSSEYSPKFLQGMLDRMSMSFHKYGPVPESFGKIDEVESLRLRLQKYVDTGNTEYLMDVANFAMIEFMQPAHPKAFYKATDSHESPGRAFVPDEFDGSVEVSQRANDYSIQ